jgi:anti-sigma factor RsiW
MTCDRMKDLVHAYLDEELSLTEQLSFEQHLATCPECEQAHRTFMQLREQIRAGNATFDMPASLETKLRRSLPAKKFPLRPLLAMAAMLMILIGSTAVVLSRAGHSSLEQDLVDAHVRSLQANHLLDVVSTDQHTVKPWFDGKLDFAPPVRDLAADGFPLIGGRLDYLRNHPVAAMIYQRGKHPINLFAWPESGADKSIKTSTINGYQVVEWRRAGMRQVAVSDLNAQELREFAEKLPSP